MKNYSPHIKGYYKEKKNYKLRKNIFDILNYAHAVQINVS